MALTSVFYDGPVTETDRATNRAGAADYGVIGAEDFKVSAHPSIPYALNLAAGVAHGYGVSDTAAATQVVQCDTLATGTRWDLIVAHRNWQPILGGPSTLEVIQGGATIPDIQTLRTIGPGVEDDQPLALVKWTGGLNTPSQIIDLRCWAGNGGLVAADKLALDYLARPGADVLIGSTTWRYSLGDNSVWGWRPEILPLVDIGQGSARPIFKSLEVRVVLNTFLVADIIFPTAFPTALVSISFQRRHTTAGPVTFTVVSGSTNRTRAQIVASGASAGQELYITYQAWGY
ncbi:MAG: hypothetical protein Q4P23_03450 [Micrococcaceae bacterium]|nr:hypothetical protein [Micrococcaceae bacterium]